MKWNDALLILANREDGENRSTHIQVLFDKIEPLCKTSTGQTPDDSETHLFDWLYEGDFTGNETPEGLAHEWDSMTED